METTERTSVDISPALISVGDLVKELRRQNDRLDETSIETGSEFGKRVPHSLEAEKGVLCGIFLDGEALEEPNTESLRVDDFYHPNHATVFAAMQNVRKAGEPITTVTILEELSKLDKLEQIGGVQYLAQLEVLLPSAAHTASYARVVKEKAMVRRAIQTTTNALNSLYKQDRKVGDVIDEAERSILEIRDDTVAKEYISAQELAWKTLEKIDALNKNQGGIGGISTGFHEFDELTNGLQPGELVIIAARPSMGKTALTLNVAAHVAIREKVPIAFFSLEMDAEQLMQRLLGAEARQDVSAMRRGLVKASLLAESTGVLADAPIHIDPTAALSIPELRRKCRRLVNRHGVKVVVIDYLQLMTGPGYENKAADVAEISKGLKSIAREFRISVIALSQLNRGVESRTDKRPMMSDLRESGAIEQDADVVALLYREEYYLREKTPIELIGVAEIIIAKNRNGPTGGLNLKFISKETRFESLDSFA